jgi:hypothetical protein
MKTQDAGKPLTQKESRELIERAKPQALLTALRSNDLAMVSAVAFQGFRIERSTLDNQIVRKRLIEEAVRNATFAAKLRELDKLLVDQPDRAPADKKPTVAKPMARRLPVAPALLPEPSYTAPDTSEKYRLERERLRRERDEAVAARKTAEVDLKQSKTTQLALESRLHEAERGSDTLRHRAERAERRMRRLEQEMAIMRRSLASRPGDGSEPQNVAPSPVPVAMASAERASASVYVDALERLFDRHKYDQVVSLCNDVLRLDSNDLNAIGLRARAHVALGNTKLALEDQRKLVVGLAMLGDMTGAVRQALRLLSFSQASAEGRILRDLLASLCKYPQLADDVRAVLAETSATFGTEQATLRNLAPPLMRSKFFDDRSGRAVGADDLLPLTAPLGNRVTARRIVELIDAGDQKAIAFMRSALPTLSVEDQASVRTALSAFPPDDDSYLNLITRRSLTGTVLVDASNVARHGQEMLVNNRASVAQLHALLRELRNRGYFPIYLIGDANLPFLADDKAAILSLEKSGLLQLVPSGTDADEYIVREARRLRAAVVTNDYMADWDMDGDVEKLQYSISPSNLSVTLDSPRAN